MRFVVLTLRKKQGKKNRRQGRVWNIFYKILLVGLQSGDFVKIFRIPLQIFFTLLNLQWQSTHTRTKEHLSIIYYKRRR